MISLNIRVISLNIRVISLNIAVISLIIAVISLNIVVISLNIGVITHQSKLKRLYLPGKETSHYQKSKEQILLKILIFVKRSSNLEKHFI